jgi:hypothetical protein
MANFKISKWTKFFFIAAIVTATSIFYYINSKTPNVLNYNDQTNRSATTTGSGSLSEKIQNPPAGAATSTPSAEPSVLNLPIPFTSQAPTGNWDLVHNEDCEEASSLMANAFLTGNTAATLPAAQVETEMTKLNDWEDSNLGYHLDTTAAETAQMITGYYGLKATVQDGYTFADIKNQINQHHVVILPVDGQIIGNPNYTQPGPIYHMLVVRGYTATGLITNDSGTRRGQNYPYTFDILHSAAADWDHTTNTIDRSKKVMIIVWK